MVSLELNENNQSPCSGEEYHLHMNFAPLAVTESGLIHAEIVILVSVSSDLESGILILLFLTITAWFLIVKSKADVSEISDRHQNRARIRTSTRQTKSSNQTVDHTMTFKDENSHARFEIDSERLLR